MFSEAKTRTRRADLLSRLNGHCSVLCYCCAFSCVNEERTCLVLHISGCLSCYFCLPLLFRLACHIFALIWCFLDDRLPRFPPYCDDRPTLNGCHSALNMWITALRSKRGMADHQLPHVLGFDHKLRMSAQVCNMFLYSHVLSRHSVLFTCSW